MKLHSKWTPHAIIKTAYDVPRPIFAAALINAEKFKRIDFATGSNPVSFVTQVIKILPIGIPCFGKTTGFIINYTENGAVEFDLYGNPISIINKCFNIGHALASV